MPFRKVDTDEDELNVEGHGACVRHIETDKTDDVEGHVIKARGIVETDTDDVEGHGARATH